MTKINKNNLPTLTDIKLAKKLALNHGAPDISGGFKVDEENKLVYILDKSGATSMIMSIVQFKKLRNMES